MKTAKMMAMVVALLVCVAVPASAAVGPLLNGSFEEYVPTPAWDIWEGTGDVFSPATSWPEAGGVFGYTGSMRTGTEGVNATDGSRFLRQASDGGVIIRATQNLGTMVTGETYKFEADVIASTSFYGLPYEAKALFVNEPVAFPGTIYATSPIVSLAAGETGALSFTYTATAGDNDMPLYIMLQAVLSDSRGGIDNARLTVTSGAGGAVPEPAGLGLVGLALLAIRKRRS